MVGALFWEPHKGKLGYHKPSLFPLQKKGEFPLWLLWNLPPIKYYKAEKNELYRTGITETYERSMTFKYLAYL